MDEVALLAAEYRRLAQEWGEGDLGRPESQNALFAALHDVQKRLAGTTAGQEAISALMRDEDPYVRLSAAAQFPQVE